MKRLQGVLGLSALYLLSGCNPGPMVRYLAFDVPYGQYQTLLRQNVSGHGQLTCKVTTFKEDRGEKWVPSVILAAAQDDAEDDTLFLDSYAETPGGQRRFHLRTFNKAQPVLDDIFVSTRDQDGDYALRLTWQEDGSIEYQVASGEAWSQPLSVQSPGFTVRHVSVHATGIQGRATCELTR